MLIICFLRLIFSYQFRCLVIGENDTDAFPFVPLSADYEAWLFVNKTDTRQVNNTCVRPVGVNVDDWKLPENLTSDKLEKCKDGYKWDYRYSL